MDFESILNSSSAGILVIDRGLRIVYANGATEALFRVGRRQLMTRRFNALYRNSSLSLENLDRVFITQAGFTDAEVDFVLEENVKLVAELNANFYAHDTSTPLLVLEIHQVTSQRKLSAESQKQALHMATKQLVRGLAHEIKNPLGGLRGAAQLLHRELPTKELQEYTDMIIEQADRLTTLVDRLLGPNQPSCFTLQNIHSVLEKTRMLACIGTEQEITVIRNYDPSIPDMLFDEHMLQQAFLNIINNAVQAVATTEKPKIELKTRVERRLTIHGQRYPLTVVVTISDNGPGISEEIRDTLFYPMITSKADGNGLGLSISQNLVEHHLGKIEAMSEPELTQFIVYLPLKTVEQQNAK